MGGSRSTRREPTHARGEHADSTQKRPQVGVEPSCYEATVLTTTPSCSPSYKQITTILTQKQTGISTGGFFTYLMSYFALSTISNAIRNLEESKWQKDSTYIVAFLV